MTGRIFHLNESGEATPLDEHPYDAEKTLQELLVKFLCDCGVKPKEIAEEVPWRTIFVEVEGDFPPEEFARRCKAEMGRKFHPDRFFCEAGQLIHSEGKTGAFVKGWGHRLPRALGNIATAFAEKGVACVRSPDR